MNVFYCDTITEELALLNEEESKHCSRVLRKQIGDTLHLFDGKGTKAVGEITHIDKRTVQVAITTREFVAPDSYFLHVAVAPTKQISRIEWFVEKSIEMGIHEISFIQTKNSERSKVNLDRMKRIALTAAKQSLSSYLPTLNEMQTYQQFLKRGDLQQTKLIATLHEHQEQVNLSQVNDVVALVGPEGGFTEEEVGQAIKAGFQPVILGKKRLRTETAALLFSSMMYQGG